MIKIYVRESYDETQGSNIVWILNDRLSKPISSDYKTEAWLVRRWVSEAACVAQGWVPLTANSKLIGWVPPVYLAQWRLERQ